MNLTCTYMRLKFNVVLYMRLAIAQAFTYIKVITYIFFNKFCKNTLQLPKSNEQSIRCRLVKKDTSALKVSINRALASSPIWIFTPSFRKSLSLNVGLSVGKIKKFHYFFETQVVQHSIKIKILCLENGKSEVDSNISSNCRLQRRNSYVFLVLFGKLLDLLLILSDHIWYGFLDGLKKHFS